MTLYEIDKNLVKAFEAAIDPETGEILDDDMMAAFEQLQMDRSVKIDNSLCMYKNMVAEAKAIREEEKALADRRRVLENRAENLKKYVERSLAGEKFESARNKVSYRRSTGVEIDVPNVFALPAEFLRYKDPEPDKTLITKALKEGHDVPGCALVESISMQIK